MMKPTTQSWERRRIVACKYGAACQQGPKSCPFGHHPDEIGLQGQEALMKCRSERWRKGRSERVEKGRPMAGYLFVCNEATRKETFERRVFGANMNHLASMKNIEASTVLFAWDLSDFTLSGPFMPVGEAGVDVVVRGFNNRFPAQIAFVGKIHTVRVDQKSMVRFGPIAEHQVRYLNRLLMAAAKGAPDRIVDQPSSPIGVAAGWVFACNQKQQFDILSKRVFGLRSQRLDLVEKAIGDDTKIFLYNTQTRLMLGTFKKAGSPALDIFPGLFQDPFRAQLPFKVDGGELMMCEDGHKLKVGRGAISASQVELIALSHLPKTLSPRPERSTHPPPEK